MARSHQSQEESFWSSLAHYAVFLVLVYPNPLYLVLGPAAALGIYYLKRRQSRVVAFQAMQSLVYQLILQAILLFFLWSTGRMEDVESIVRGFRYRDIILVIGLVYGFLAGLRCLFGFNFRYLLLGRLIERFMQPREQ